MHHRQHKSELIVALDFENLKEALDFVETAGDSVTWYKIGSQLFCSAGPSAVSELKKRGKKVFLDLKFHDIPNTVASAVAEAVKMGADMVNVHASGGREMMKAAVKAANEKAKTGSRPLVIAVTVLTSMDAQGLSEAMNRSDSYSPSTHVPHLAKLAKDSGMDGVVASAHEIELIRKACGDDFVLVIPGIRPADSSTDDQKRIMTPAEAVRKGANFLVVGRPVLKAEIPAEAARAIKAEMDGCFN
ncbi:MAG TPA: orotidine-5'-phosphate decarboxylase [Lentisphaeria bacterium]|nr:MAG: orotidine 5'-phosphate decarboxylase [Lentisphaerae bacterium GWF2_50_93]HCE42426.1 orotidine-5'-phosphate decarboxylase [Lentisphaeria bacterium]